MNKKVNELATAYDAANSKLNEVAKLVRRENNKLVGEVEVYYKANDEYVKALRALRDAVGIRAMCGFVGDDGTKSAAEFFSDFPEK